jgi:hypothetical protein
MLTPFLIIGVGGSGGKTLRSLRQTLLRRLRAKGWEGDMPEAWQFLEIDTISTQAVENFPADLLPSDQYLGLVPTGVNYEGLKAATMQNVMREDQMSSLAGWLPETTAVPIAKGAGQFRTLGRAVVVSQLNRVAEKLRNSHNRLTAPGVDAELRSVAKLLYGKDEGQLPPPIAIVVSSIAGGSGAGIFLDVVEALKSIDTGYADRTHTFVYGPDVFNSVPAGMRDSIPANALGAMNEIVAGLWADGPGEGSAALFRSAGLIGEGTRGFGSKHTYLVGASNGLVNFPTQDSVYLATGESLATLVSDEKIQDWFTNFIIVNVFVNSANEMICDDRSKLKVSGNVHHMQPLASIGVGRVSLGLERFTEYIAEGLARASSEKMLWPQFEPEDPLDPKTPSQKIDEDVDREWSEFLTKSGLNERGESNEVIDYLVGVAAKDRAKAFAQKGLNFAEQGVDAAGLPNDQWISRLMNFFNLNRKAFETDELAEIHKLAQNWTIEIQKQIIRTVSLEISRRGLNVTTRLIERLRDEVQFVAKQELPLEAAAELRKIDQLASKLNESLPAGMSKVQAQAMRQATGPRLAQVSEFITNSQRRSVAAELLADLDESFLKPLETLIKNSSVQLLQAATSPKTATGESNPFPNYADIASGTIPDRFQASVVERLLIPVETYPSEFQKLVKESLPSEEQTNWWNRTLERVTLGTFLDQRGDDQEPSLISIRANWVPANSSYRATNAGSTKAEFFFETNPQNYIDRNRKWLSDPVTSLGKFLIQDLVTFLSHPDPAVQSKRRTEFRDGFSTALKLSAPLCALNNALIGQVHPNVSAKGSRYLHMSRIPFVNQGNLADLYKLAETTIKDAKLWDDANSPKVFDLASGVQQIDMFSTVTSAMNPMVFTSLMEDIAQKWSKNSVSQNLMQGFWTNRRARPLTEAIPVAPEKIQDMVRGWYLATILDQKKQLSTPQQGPKISIWSPDANGYVDFPHPLLPLKNPGASSNPEILPAVLKSLSLAMAACHTQSNLEPLRPYMRLMEIGENAKDIIENWTRNGKLESGAPTPTATFAGTSESTFQERRAAILTTLEKTSTALEAIFVAEEKSRDVFKVAKVWELRYYIRIALSDLTEFTMHLTTNEGAAF